MSTTELQATGTFAADPVHSHIGFEVPYAVATFSGEVTDFSATLADGHLEGSAKIESITLKDENLTAHVLSPEFFDAERHPLLTFSGDVDPGRRLLAQRAQEGRVVRVAAQGAADREDAHVA